MTATKKILTSLHGKRVGLAQDGTLVVGGRTVVTQDDTGAVKIFQGNPATLNATGTLPVASLFAGIVTSTTASAVTATLPLGADLSAEGSLAIGEAIRWNVINTGGSNAFTIQANTNHTIVGAAAVAASTSAEFLTRRTGTSTWVTYRV